MAVKYEFEQWREDEPRWAATVVEASSVEFTTAGGIIFTRNGSLVLAEAPGNWRNVRPMGKVEDELPEGA